ncbi:UNVERIFIED_CONTAM: Auxin-responsive protein SAUR32 [Sesamum angustifolium]|uniref:Auxin-responsive protein SAUR32 n=1 Tax=Sesamum angustifolium TaxID=2727405 RepID=A0AAW2N630_9LAMI
MAIERRKGLIAFKLLVKKLQNHLHRSRRVLEMFRRFECEEVEAKESVRDDVKKGHFAILAVKNEMEKPTRFVVELCLLKQPAFLRLLKLAEEEYGFQQTGTLAVPCPPEELKRILQDKTWKNTNKRDFNMRIKKYGVERESIYFYYFLQAITAQEETLQCKPGERSSP